MQLCGMKFGHYLPLKFHLIILLCRALWNQQINSSSPSVDIIETEDVVVAGGGNIFNLVSTVWQ